MVNRWLCLYVYPVDFDFVERVMITAILVVALITVLVVLVIMARNYTMVCKALCLLNEEHQRMAWRLTKITGDDKPWRVEE